MLLDSAVHIATVSISYIAIIAGQLEQNTVSAYLNAGEVGQVHVETSAAHHEGLGVGCADCEGQIGGCCVGEYGGVLEEGGEVGLEYEGLVLEVLQDPVGYRKYS